MITDSKGTLLINSDKYNDHVYDYHLGVYTFLETNFDKKLKDYLKKLKQFRELRNERLKDPTIYDQLPHIKGNQWNARKRDLKQIEKLLKETKNLDILEIGAWNGWLSNRLSKMGHNVTAIDYFMDEYDGLAAKKHYIDNNWTAIQMDVDEIDVIKKKMDLIVFNNNFSYLSDPFTILKKAKALLKDEGMIFILGLAFFSETTHINNHFSKLIVKYKEQYGLDLFVKPCKMYFTESDKTLFKKSGIQLKWFPWFLKSQISSFFYKNKPAFFFGLYKK